MDRLIESMTGFVKHHVAQRIVVSDKDATDRFGPRILQLARSGSLSFFFSLISILPLAPGRPRVEFSPTEFPKPCALERVQRNWYWAPV